MSEKLAVEQPAIATLEQLGYTHLPGAAVTIPSERRHLAPVLEETLTASLVRLNPWLTDSPSGVAGVRRELVKLQSQVSDSLMAANRAIWEKTLFRSDIQLKDAEGRVRSVRFIDPTIASANVFHVVDQYVGRNADGELFRPDLLLFINGLPLAIIECKDTHHKLDEALSQLDGYQKAFAAQFVFNQMCVGLNRRQARYAGILTPPKFYQLFKLDAAELAEATAHLEHSPDEQETLLWALFSPARFLQLVAHFVLFETRDGKTVKKLPRYQQWRAVRKTVQRLQTQGLGGVVWHTQGSGKSLTMVLLARLLRAEATGLGNPSVLVLTDRTDLDEQIWGTFVATGVPAIKAESVDGLVRMLSNDYGAVFTSTVQKFQEREDHEAVATTPEDEPQSDDQASRHRRIKDNETFFIVEERNSTFGLHDADGKPLRAKWEEVSREPVSFRVLSTKPNFYVLVDEAHRSQYDFLAAFMRASLPHAKFVAFTGTPLMKDDKHTLAEFGGGTYIDEYRLHEAVEDGATLPIKYLEAWVGLSSDGKLDEAFNECFGSEAESRREALKKALLQRWRSAEDRLQKVVEHLVGHFLTSVQAKGQKAMLVCNGRDMAVRYQDLLREVMAQRQQQGLPTFDSRVVISLAGITGSRTGATEVESAEEKNVALETIEERIRREQKEGNLPVAVPSDKVSRFVGQEFLLPYGEEANNTDQQLRVNNVGLVIVSDMLLTGWDAPIVGTLYLDKPIKEHTLLQAIARVNRTRDGKSAGYIVDYHGVVEELDHALKLYGGEVLPAQVWSTVESELPKLQSVQGQLLALLPRKHNPQTQVEMYKADAEAFLDPAERLDAVEDFLALVKEFNRLLDIILPDVRAVPFKPYFILFGEIRLALRDKLPDAVYRERITRLESALLQQMLDQHIAASSAYSLLGHEVSILDAADMERLRKLAGSTSQALVMKNQLKHTIRTGKDKDPGFFSKLEDELQKLLEEEKAGRITQTQFLEQLELFSQRIRDKDHTGFAHPAHSAVYHYLSGLMDEATARSATEKLFDDSELTKTLGNTNWKLMTDLHPDLKDHLRKRLMPLAGWERGVAREHAGRVLDILLKN